MDKVRKQYMLDTSAVIDDPYNVIRLNDHGENDIFINNVVYGEINNLKKSKDGEAGFQAREFFRIVKECPIKILTKSQYPKSIKHKKLKKNGDSIIEFTFTMDGTSIPLYSIIRNDFRAIKQNIVSMGNEINDLCISELAYDHKMNLITSDGGLYVYHQIAGGTCEFITNDSYKSASQQNFLYEIKTPPHALERKEDGTVKGNLIDLIGLDDRENEHTNFTQFKFIEMAKREENGEVVEYESGRVDFGIKYGNVIELIDFNKETGCMKDSILTFKNKEQAMYYYILTHPQNKITSCSGATGSGKTLLALAAGLELVKKGEIDGIVYTRNTVTSNDAQSEMGFRKGGEDTKLGFFMMPLYSAVNTIIEVLKDDPKKSLNTHSKYSGDTDSFNKEDATEAFMKDNKIEVVDIAHLRGVTVSNKMVIIDEAQNLSSAGLKLTGTRSGENVRFLVLGDGGQIDHPFLSKNRNSLAKMLDIATRDDFVAGVQLRSTVRSDTAEWFDKNL